MAIESLDEAKATARLIQSGQIAGPARDKAMAALREFDTKQVVGPTGRYGSGKSLDVDEDDKLVPSGSIDQSPSVLGTVGEKTANLVLGAPEAIGTLVTSAGAGVKAVAQGAGELAAKGAVALRGDAQPNENLVDNAVSTIQGNTLAPVSGFGRAAQEQLAAPLELAGHGLGQGARALGVPEPIANEIEMQTPNVANIAMTLAGGPKAAVERPRITVKHVADETGHHTTISPNGETLSTETAFGRLRATRDDTAASARGQGEATARIEKMIKEAEARGLIPESDISLSPAEANIWRTKLAERGYKIKENPNEPSVNGIVSKDAKKGIFEIEPATKPAAAKERGQMTPQELHADDVAFLLDNSIPLTTENRGTNAARKSVGGLARGADAALGDSPKRAVQDQAVTSTALDTVGASAKNASPEVMGALKKDIGGKMNVLHDAVPTHITANVVAKLNELGKEARMHPNASAIIARIEHIKEQVQAGNAETGAPAVISGKAAQSIRTSLNEAMGSTHSDIVQMSGKLIDLLDDAFEKSAEAVGKPELAAQMDIERGRWHRMRQIEDAVKGSATHTVSPSKLLTALERKRNRNQSMYGNTPDPMDAKLNRLAHAAKNVLKEPVGNSGTVARGVGAGALALAGEAAVLGHPVAAAVSLAGLYGAAKAARMLNETNMARGTKSAKAAAVKPTRGQLTAKAIRAAAAGSIASNVSPEERKRRLQAEALRNAQ